MIDLSGEGDVGLFLQLPDRIDGFAGVFQLSRHHPGMGGIDHVMPMPLLNVRKSSVSSIPPACLSQLKTGGRGQYPDQYAPRSFRAECAAGFPETRHR